MRPNRQQLAVIVAIVAVILLAGCLSMTLETTVNEDGGLDELVIEMEMDEFLYNLFEDDARQEGYASLEEYFMAEAEAGGDDPAWQSASYDEEHVDGSVIVTITAEDGDPALIDTIDVDADEDEISFVERDTFDEVSDEDLDEFMGQVQLTYIVNMPGEITETNGEVLDDGSSVRWTAAQHNDLDRFQVASERPASSSIPGFGVVAVIVGMVGLALGWGFLRGRR